MRDDARADEELVLASRSGDREAFAHLVDRWFDRCWEVAWRILHDHGLAADVAQDVLLTAWQQLDRLAQPGSFGGWVLRISRNRALDRLERERRTMSIGDDEVLEGTVAGRAPGSASVTGPAAGLGNPDDEVVRAGQEELVWAAAAALGERDASLLDLHLRHGLEPGELAHELGITPNAAHQALFRLRSRLGDAIRAWLLWRGGKPDCVVLQAEVAAAGLSSFDAALTRLITGHAEECVACSDERARVTAPAALFGAVPLVLAPTLARAAALDGLRTAGVPVPSGPEGALPAEWSTADEMSSGGELPGRSGAEPRPGSTPEPGPGSTPEPTPQSTVESTPGSAAGSSPRSERPDSVWHRVRVPALLLVVLLLVGGLIHWGPGTSEPLAPIADAGAGDVVSGATEADPGTEGPLEEEPTHLGGPVIDGTSAEVEPMPLPPSPDAPTTSGETPDRESSSDVTSGGGGPQHETPRTEAPNGEGTTDEEPATEQPGEEEPGEEPVEPEEPTQEPPTARLVLTDLGGTCELEGQTRPRYWHVEWLTADATTVHLDLGAGAGPEPVAASGSTPRVCLPLGAIVELTAVNEAGSTSTSETAIPT